VRPAHEKPPALKPRRREKREARGEQLRGFF